MRITHYGYNSFVVESGGKKFAIDPGALFFHYFRFTTLIPKEEWDSISHIFVTHGDPDHYWHTDRMALASNAHVICNTTMVKVVDGRDLMLGPRNKGLSFTSAVENVRVVSAGETIELDGVKITGVKTAHGPLTFRFGPFSKTLKPGPEERIGWGAIGFKIECDGKIIVNLGDTILFGSEWDLLRDCDVLMLPIGGKAVHNTMDEMEALEAVQNIHPKVVVPCHYNCPAFFTDKYNPADEKKFKSEVNKLGMECELMYSGDTIEV